MHVVLLKVTIVTKTCRNLGILHNYLTSYLKHSMYLYYHTGWHVILVWFFSRLRYWCLLLYIIIYHFLSTQPCNLYHFGDDVMSSDVTQKSLENKFVFFVCGLNSFDFEMDFFVNFVIFELLWKVSFQF